MSNCRPEKPAGAEEYEWRVHNALVDPRSAAELYEYGAQQVALYDARLKEVARQIDPSAKTVLEVARKLSDDAPGSIGLTSDSGWAVPRPDLYPATLGPGSSVHRSRDCQA